MENSRTPRRKTRTGCWTCKQRKVKCTEEKPRCEACVRLNLQCGYGIKLLWEDEALARGVEFGRATSSARAKGRKQAIKTYERSYDGSAFNTQLVHKGFSGLTWHFLNFTVEDFRKEGLYDIEGRDDDEDDESWNDSSPPSSSDSSQSAAWSSDSIELVDEPSWFPPLDNATGFEGLLFTHYATVITHNCTMYDDTSNGYRTFIVPMSATSPVVLHSLLSVAAFSLQRKNPTYKIHALAQKENTLILLRQLIHRPTPYQQTSPDTVFEILAAIIMLCVFEIKDGAGPNWIKHLQGAMTLLGAKTLTNRQIGSASWVAEGMIPWANKFVAYQYVNGGSADPVSELAFQRPEFWTSCGMEITDIDGSMGCSAELMALIARLNALARQRDGDASSSASSTSSPGDISTPQTPPAPNNLSTLEWRLFTLSQTTHHCPILFVESVPTSQIVTAILSAPNISTRAKILVLTAEARRQAALVFLYSHSRLRNLPATHPTVKYRVEECLGCVEGVMELLRQKLTSSGVGGDMSTSRHDDVLPGWGMTPLLWPLFIAGRCATEGKRVAVIRIFETLEQESLLGNVVRARGVTERAWKRADMAHLEDGNANGYGKDGNGNIDLFQDSPQWALSLG